ncbi:MAG TPA: hypothetical protein VFA47_12225, partial [Candidatus Manganitrophaceae bacterium]|nr:hypothetical protein [Candidatus Manganitrophaceae bacterium]
MAVSLFDLARTNLRDTLLLALEYRLEEEALLVYDEQSALSRLLGEAYRAVLPKAAALNFDRTAAEEILTAVDTLPPGALVALVQSTSFRL